MTKRPPIASGATAHSIPALYRVAASARRTLRGRGTRFVYNSAIAEPLRRLLTSRAPAGTKLIKICGGPLRGTLMHVELSCEKYYWLGTHEEHVQSMLAEIVRPGCVAYDIGAHAGLFSLLLSRLAGPAGLVMAFDPLSANIERLRANTAVNGARNVEAYKLAISDRAGDASFSLHASSLEGTLSYAAESNRGVAATTIVRTVSIDDLVRDGMPPPDVIKIDVEGAEGAALRGARRTLGVHSPAVMIEIHSLRAASEVVDALPPSYVYIDAATRATVRPPLSAGHYLARPAT